MEIESENRRINIEFGIDRVWKDEKKEEKKEKARWNRWRTPSLEKAKFPRRILRKMGENVLGSFVAQVVDGGKRTKVGMLPDPEKGVKEGLPLMVKVGSVR